MLLLAISYCHCTYRPVNSSFDSHPPPQDHDTLGFRLARGHTYLGDMASSLRRRMKILWLAPKKTWLSSVKMTLSHWSLTFHLTLTLLTFSSLKHFCGTLVDINIAVQFMETLVWVCDSVDHSCWLNHPNGQVWLSEAASLKIFHLWGPDSVGSRWEVCFLCTPSS